MQDLKFVHLHVHSTYSLLEGAALTKDICAKAQRDKQPAIALTDSNNLFGSFEFTNNCLKHNIQPIIGCQLRVNFSEEKNLALRDLDKYCGNVVFLAASQQGLTNLLELSSLAYLGYNGSDPNTDFPYLEYHWLKDFSEGLIVLSGGYAGALNCCLSEGNVKLALERLDKLQYIFADNLYIELQRYKNYNKKIEAWLLDQALQRDLEIVAANEVFFLEKNQAEAHDALLAIADGDYVANKNRRHVPSDSYLKTQAEMAELFADLPIALANSINIAQKCTALLQKRSPILPRYIVQQHGEFSKKKMLQLEAQELRKQAEQGLEARLANIGLAEGYSKEDYYKRLNFELDVITKMEFPGYFLIVADFIKWAKSQDIPVGPGRGSGAGALVAYALTITDIDPIKFSLLFERFLNPERVSMPDFDIDFCQERRGEVIKYVQSRYGRDRVAHIITFGKLQARAVLRDVGRVLELPYSKVDSLCKMVPQNPGLNITLAQAIEDEPRFQEEREKDHVIDRMLIIAQQLEGLYRHASTHAAGIVIGDRPLYQLVPMYFDIKASMPVTQYNMKYVEEAGLVKFDFLGLKTLSVLKKATDLVKKSNPDFNLEKIDLHDKKTYEMLSQGNTLGVFQIESSGMQNALVGMQPDSIEDLIALVALYRPGPMDNIPIYNSRKNGKEKVEYIHHVLESVLKETHGVIIYQEQVMQIAQLLSGYSLGEADLLRRAMGKKIHSEMEVQRSRFVDGAIKNGLTLEKATEIFDLLAKFADYGFNKSHAAAYAMISYQTAFMKANYPVAFLAATMTYEMLNLEKLNIFRLEAKRLNIDILPPNIQNSSRDFNIAENKIYYSLAAIKGVGEKVAEHIAEVRGNQPFASLEDFCKRIDVKEVNKLAWQGLICAGAFDCFGIERDILYLNLPNLMDFSVQSKQDNQQDLFAGVDSLKLNLKECNEKEKWMHDEKIHKEFTSLGFYISGHPLDQCRYNSSYRSAYNSASLVKTSQYSKNKIKKFSTAATLVSYQLKKTKKGDRMAILSFSQPADEQFEALLFSDKLQQYNSKLVVGSCMLVSFEIIQYPDRDERVNIVEIDFLDESSNKIPITPTENNTKNSINNLEVILLDANFIKDIVTLLAKYHNYNASANNLVKIRLYYKNNNNKLCIDLPGNFALTPELQLQLKNQKCEVKYN